MNKVSFFDGETYISGLMAMLRMSYHIKYSSQYNVKPPATVRSAPVDAIALTFY